MCVPVIRYLDMKLAVHGHALLVDQFEGVRAVAVHMAKAVWSTAIGEQEHHLMDRLGTQTPEVPHHTWILQIDHSFS